MFKNIFKKLSLNQFYFIIGFAKSLDMFNHIDVTTLTFFHKVKTISEVKKKHSIIYAGMITAAALIISPMALGLSIVELREAHPLLTTDRYINILAICFVATSTISIYLVSLSKYYLLNDKFELSSNYTEEAKAL